MFGHTGKILRVDLTTGQTQPEPYSPDFARAFLGGNGFAAQLIHDSVPSDVDPLSPANALAFTVGPLTGSGMWGTSRGHVAAISPLTGFFGDSNFGGQFAVAQKRTGFDVIFFTGKADKPLYLLLTDEGPRLEDACELWGQTTGQTVQSLQDKYGKAATTACIGPAGENLVLFAGILSQGVRHGLAGRCGLGAVMGSKNLKAIVALGTAKTPLADQPALNAFLKTKADSIRANTEFLTDYGTPILVDMINQRGLFSSHNAAREVFDSADMINAKVIKEGYVERNVACYGCAVACGKKVRVPAGEYAGQSIKMPEYETLFAIGSMLDNSDIVSIINANGLCDQYGLDTISMGVTLSFVAECLEQGLVAESDLGGKVEFADGPGLVRLVKATALRQGIGDLLALGSQRLADKFGPQAHKYLYAVRGLEIAGHSARALRPMALAYATSTRGGSHQDGRPMYVAPDEDPGFGPQPQHCVDTEDRSTVGDSLVLCRFIHERGLGPTGWDDLAVILRYTAGWDIDAHELRTIGRRIYNLERLINVARGASRQDDTLPYRPMNEPTPDGPAKGRLCSQQDLDKILDEYYRLRGWTNDGIPTPQTLSALNLPAPR